MDKFVKLVLTINFQSYPGLQVKVSNELDARQSIPTESVVETYREYLMFVRK